MDSKLQTRIMIGISLLVVAGIMIYVSLSTPKVYESTTTTIVENSSYQSINSEAVEQTTLPVGVVNLNTATFDELTAIDGIGEKRANLIISYREHLGGYTSVSQIKDIEGIGDTIYSQISPYLTV